MRKTLRRLLVFVSSLVSLLFARLAFAALDLPKPAGLPGSANDTAGLWAMNIILYLLTIVGIVAVGYLIYGGFQYITSGGNDEQAESGKKTIQNAIIGLVIIILSYVIVAVITNFLMGHVA